MGGGSDWGVCSFFPNWVPLFWCYLSICISIPLFPGHLWFMARQAMYSLPREERYKPFALKCLWLEKIRSCNSPASCKLFKLFGLVQFSCLSSFVSVSHSTWPGIFPAFYYPLSYVPFSIIENMSHRLVILHPNICGFDSGTTSQLILDSQPQGMFSTTPCSLFNIYLPLIPVSPCLICSPS